VWFGGIESMVCMPVCRGVGGSVEPTNKTKDCTCTDWCQIVGRSDLVMASKGNSSASPGHFYY
jgi:hypothetical protein